MNKKQFSGYSARTSQVSNHTYYDIRKSHNEKAAPTGYIKGELSFDGDNS